MAEKKTHRFDSLTFLLPWRLIKSRHFSRKDVRNIKDYLTASFSTIYLIAAAGLAAIITGLSIYMLISTNNHYVEKYGLAALIGQIFIVFSSVASVILIIISRIVKRNRLSINLIRIAGDLLYVGCAAYMLCGIFSDAQMGFTTHDVALSASIIFVAILALMQPMHWSDAFALDLVTTLGIIGISIYCANAFGMQAIYYYIIIAMVYPFACYLVVALLFYAESSRYIEILENERLHNHAYYDHLTHCKNRHALSEFLAENKYRWENKENVNLLITLFDIDDFKLYNDQFSHLGGDYCLKSICDAIRQEFPSPSLDFFRYGGEEFLLFFELENASDAPMTLERIRKAISNLDINAPKGAPKKVVTISLGGLLIKNIKTFEFEKEMQIVDAYLYKAKSFGKDVVCYNDNIIN